ncbi:girdin-like isoform X1 [Cyprinodon tularosa]|uniref:girdin-like isoform X1 n=1 Tax=Cyprinodon tularosa TaxID=77115 RepID=UPI0018E20591|nr:girdin-like isoform X1 [Cyprinodon tularosa]
MGSSASTPTSKNQDTENRKADSKLKTLQEDNKKLLHTLNQIKDQLETQKSNLCGQLEEVEKQREECKKELRLVDEEINKKETSDGMEELLAKKEKMLKSLWDLNMKKKNDEIKLLNIEKELEPIDIQLK